MSTVVGLIQDGNVYIGTDSRASTEDGEIKPIVVKKMFKNKGYTIAFVGSVRAGQILYPRYFSPPDDIWEFPDAIRHLAEEKGTLSIGDRQESLIGCNYLFVKDGKLYEMMMDFQMLEIEDFSVLGSGSYYANGSLYTTRNMTIHPKERVRLALEAAAKFSAGTGPPFHIKIVE
jgi:ATP-dependent protease HslVU (ClpYQ) peptidase subunit